MRTRRNVELLFILACVAVFCACLEWTQSKSLAEQTQLAADFPPTVLRWSIQGGCYEHSEFYFELRTDDTGATWVALLYATGGWNSFHIEHLTGNKLISGNYLGSGRMSEEQTKQLLDRLMATDPLEVRNTDFHTGPNFSLYLNLGGQENKVASFQEHYEEPETPEYRFTSLVNSDVFGDAWTSLRERYEAGEQPDTPLQRPGTHWLTNESQTLFQQYPELLQQRSLETAPK